MRAIEVPDIRLELLNLWRPGGMLEKITLQVPDDVPGNMQPVEVESARRNLRHAQLFWVAGEFANVLASVAETIPTEITPNDLDPPLGATNGLVVFEEPWTAPDYMFPGQEIRVQAFAYGMAYFMQKKKWALRMMFYAEPRSPELRRVTRWWYVGATDWGVEDPIDAPVKLNGKLLEEPAVVADAIRDRRFMAALALLINQKILAAAEEQAMPRPVARRSARAGLPSTVKVIYLRHAQHGGVPEGEGGAIDWSHRWIVNGHWRNQAYGPGRQQRRWTFIAPHVKGPADKPLILKDTVNALIR